MFSFAIDQTGMYCTVDLHMCNSFDASLHAPFKERTGVECRNQRTLRNLVLFVVFPACSEDRRWVVGCSSPIRCLSVPCVFPQDVTVG